MRLRPDMRERPTDACANGITREQAKSRHREVSENWKTDHRAAGSKRGHALATPDSLDLRSLLPHSPCSGMKDRASPRRALCVIVTGRRASESGARDAYTTSDTSASTYGCITDQNRSLRAQLQSSSGRKLPRMKPLAQSLRSDVDSDLRAIPEAVDDSPRWLGDWGCSSPRCGAAGCRRSAPTLQSARSGYVGSQFSDATQFGRWPSRLPRASEASGHEIAAPKSGKSPPLAPEPQLRPVDDRPLPASPRAGKGPVLDEQPPPPAQGGLMSLVRIPSAAKSFRRSIPRALRRSRAPRLAGRVWQTY